MKNQTLLIAAMLLCMSFIAPEQRKKITVWLAGDSTMSIKETKAYPETGWGMPFNWFFDSTVTVKNIAKNGRSTKTFISEKLWETIEKNIQEGDYVFIQFGHNDESKEKTERYTTPEEYKANLTKFITETRAKRGNPVLITPVSRRKFKDSVQVQTHEVYSAIVRQLAQEQNVPLIDLDTKSMELYQKFGAENSKLLFMQLKPGEHPNYPEGREDNTHFNELGARLIAQIVLAEIKKLKLELAERIVVPKAK